VTLKGNRPKRRKGKGDESAIGRFSEKVQRMPLLVYVLGVPTKVAVGTDLFEVSSQPATGRCHAIKGNVDIMITLVMHTGAAVGAQIGVLAVAASRSGFGYFWVAYGTPDEGMTIHQAVIPSPMSKARLSCSSSHFLRHNPPP
jgi:hypothetical protein